VLERVSRALDSRSRGHRGKRRVMQNPTQHKTRIARSKRIVVWIAAAFVLSVFLCEPSFARPPGYGWHGHRYYWHGRWYHGYPPRYYYAPPPVIYYPPPVVYRPPPPPVVYAPPPPPGITSVVPR
jgi:hypothetical protein